MTSKEPFVIAEANAGAAKTTTLACRIGEALVGGADPRAILALTYTEAAVSALRQSLERIGIQRVVRNAIRVRTFERFCGECLQGVEGRGVLQRDTPEAIKTQVMTALARVYAEPRERYREALNHFGEASVEGLLATFLRLKGTMLLHAQAAGRTLTPQLAEELGQDYTTLRAFSAYEALRWDVREERAAFRAPGDATYDLAMRLCADDPAFADDQLLPGHLALVVVDEMHDTHRAMFTVLARLLQANPSACFVGVGDRDQVLHAVAGADADFIGAAFDREIAPAARPPLTASYRFGPSLAGPAGLLAKKAYSSASQRRTEVIIVACDSACEPEEGKEHQRVALAIAGREGLRASMRNSDIAVLLRQPNQSIALENLLIERGMDYVVEGFLPYLMRTESLSFAASSLAPGMPSTPSSDLRRESRFWNR